MITFKLIISIFGFIYLSSIAGEYYALMQIGSEEYVVIDGALNVWATYSGCFILTYLIYYYFMSLKDKEPSPKQLNYAVLIIAVIISPLLTLSTYTIIHNNLNDYVKCNSLNKWSSRYSSSTYAISKEVCMTLVTDRKNKL
ncbi:hypothetical protein [Aliivibrio fischeri]|uniref:hypothetical protein n=1 Tax=Aliivibrio fischeri TaxID=668 RepID=UPI00373709A5